MSARKARTEAAAAGAAPVDSEEKDVKIPVEAADDTEVNEAPAAEAAENQVEDSNKEATMTEDEMVEAAIRAGEEAADNDFKLKFEQAQKELADVRNELDAAAEAQKAAEDKAKDATERTARLQADWENFRRRTANERIAERERATEKLVGNGFVGEGSPDRADALVWALTELMLGEGYDYGSALANAL